MFGEPVQAVVGEEGVAPVKVINVSAIRAIACRRMSLKWNNSAESLCLNGAEPRIDS